MTSIQYSKFEFSISCINFLSNVYALGKDEKFDENCCRNVNVSKECMGNCRDAQNIARSLSRLESQCKMFEDKIKKCIVLKEGS